MGESFASKVKEAKQEHGIGFQFVRVVLRAITAAVGTIACIALGAIILAVPIAQIYFGVEKKGLCTIQDYIPIWLIVCGASGIVSIVLSVFQNMCSDENGESLCPCLRNVSALLNLFNLAWFICGNVWVYKAFPDVNYEDVTAAEYCDKTAYLLAFWCITSAYIILGAACVLGCLVCMCVTCFN